jgi:iron complex transport system ATP-binding protein
VRTPDGPTRSSNDALACATGALSVRLGDATILDRVDLECARGEWLGIIGPNGAGKTTLLRALCGLVRLTGTIHIAGHDATTLSRREWSRQVALVPQTPVLPPGIRVVDYVLLGRTPHLGLFEFEGTRDLAVVDEVLELLDLTPFAERPIETLSGGERQRAVLARALAQRAPLLVLDEPTSALDIGHRHDVLELVDDLRRSERLSVVTTLHDLALAGAYPDRLVLLDKGRVAANGVPAEVLTPDIIRTHFGIEVDVRHEEGGLVVIPRRRRPR